MRTALLLLLVACEHGQTPDGDGGSFETAQFLPQFCTEGEPDAPGNPNPLCPVMRIPLDFGGAVVELVARPLSSALELSFAIGVTSGFGIHAEHPQILVDGDVLFDFEITFEIASGAKSDPITQASATSVDSSSKWNVRFAALSPL
jgi:hypothetical protein